MVQFPGICGGGVQTGAGRCFDTTEVFLVGGIRLAAFQPPSCLSTKRRMEVSQPGPWKGPTLEDGVGRRVRDDRIFRLSMPSGVRPALAPAMLL